MEESYDKISRSPVGIGIRKDKEILRLKSQIAKDSSNFSKPSSSNGFEQVPNNRKKTAGNKGNSRGIRAAGWV
ncbi:MAG: hypothetical protein K2K63_06865 [Acetatifactor sp.]|nr:hypothetical protein [Acetatifactor sp.]